MADEKMINGVASDVDDPTAESFYDLDQRENDTKVSELARKIEALEREKLELVNENEETKERIKTLTAEIEGLKRDEAEMKQKMSVLEREIELSVEGTRALESVAARAVALETEVSRLQHDLGQVNSEGYEANLEVMELKKVLEEKGARIEGLERDIEVLKTTKAESEMRVRELERKIGVLEVREIEGKSEKVRFEGEMRGKVEEKERVISGFKTRVEELEAVIVKNGAELKKWMDGKSDVEEELRVSKEGVRLMESKMVQLQKEAEAAEKVISGLKEKTIEAVNGTVSGMGAAFGGEEKGLSSYWPAVAVGFSGIIAAAAVVYVCSKRR